MDKTIARELTDQVDETIRENRLIINKYASYCIRRDIGDKVPEKYLNKSFVDAFQETYINNKPGESGEPVENGALWGHYWSDMAAYYGCDAIRQHFGSQAEVGQFLIDNTELEEVDFEIEDADWILLERIPTNLFALEVAPYGIYYELSIFSFADFLALSDREWEALNGREINPDQFALFEENVARTHKECKTGGEITVFLGKKKVDIPVSARQLGSIVRFLGLSLRKNEKGNLSYFGTEDSVLEARLGKGENS